MKTCDRCSRGCVAETESRDKFIKRLCENVLLSQFLLLITQPTPVNEINIEHKKLKVMINEKSGSVSVVWGSTPLKHVNTMVVYSNMKNSPFDEKKSRENLKSFLKLTLT